MKIKNLFVFILLVTLLVAYSAYCGLTNTYDTATPGGSDDPRQADDRMREIKAAVQERMNDHNGTASEGDHYWPLTGTEVSDTAAGQHRMVTLRQLSDNPSTLTSYATTTDLGFLFQKNMSGNGELFYEDEADNVIQLTSGGGLYSSTTLDVVGVGTIGGTLDVTGLSELIGVATIADDSVTKTTAVADNPAEIANLATVDAQIAAAEIKDLVGHYDTGVWTACSAATTATITHSLNSTLLNVVILFSTASNGSNCTRLGWFHDSGNISGGLIMTMTANNFVIQFGSSNAGYSSNSSGATQYHSTGYYRVLATRIK